jgi:hypothetical protein
VDRTPVTDAPDDVPDDDAPHLPDLPGEERAGLALARVGPGAAFAVAGIALAAAVLVPAGLWRPVVAVPVALVVLAVAVRLAASVPARPAPVWATATTVLVAAAHGVHAALTHAEHVVLRRDSGSYALYAHWIATRHGLPVDADVAAFGGPQVFSVPGFSLASPAYYQVLEGPAGDPTGAHVVPQFLVGAPALWSFGWWADGWAGLLVVPALVSALAVLAFGGLAARVVGARWAPLAAASLAVCFPVLHVARSTYSEAPALLLLSAALALVVDATRAGRDPARAGAARRLALAAGVLLGLTGLVRVDVLREVSLLLPACAVLALRRHPAARPLAVGALGATAVAAVADVVLSRPYLGSIAGSLLPLAAAFVALGLGSAAAVAVGRSRVRRPGRPPATWARQLPAVAGALVALTGVVLAARPLFLVVRQSPDDPGSRYVRGLQAGLGLPLDGGRTYAEHSLGWVVWWTGPVAVVAGWAALAGLAALGVRWFLRSATDGPVRTPAWLVPAIVGAGSLVLTLYRPGITPDHPWADRRLAPVVLPVVVLAATATAAAAFRWARRRMPATVFAGVAVVGAAALLVPPVLATSPLAGLRTERGEVAAVAGVCAALRPGDVVLAVDPRGTNEWPQVVRGVCDRPAGVLRVPRDPSDADLAAARRGVDAVRDGVARAGGRLVLLAAGGDEPGRAALAALGVPAAGLAAPVVSLDTVEDARVLTTRPRRGQRLTVEVWLAPAPG